MTEWLDVETDHELVWLLLGDERDDDTHVYEFVLTPEKARALSSLLQDAADRALGVDFSDDEETEVI